MLKATSRKLCKTRPRIQLIGNHTCRIQWYHLEPYRVTPNKGLGPQFGETVYISEVNVARKVKPNAQVAMNKNSDPMQIIFP